MKPNCTKNKASFQRGFSLIELLTVVIIIGILASIAVPQYLDYLRKAKLTDGTALLADYRVKLEQYYQDNRNYGVAGGICTGATIPYPTSQYFDYVCTVGVAPADTYITTATNKSGGGLGATGDYTYTLDQSQNKATSKYKGSSVTKTCWLIGGSEC